jgi:peptide/nickel transport system permease protein
MKKMILKRLLSLIPVFFGIILITFCIINILPGDPALIIAGERAAPETIEQIRESMGLNQGLHIQFYRFFTNIIKGDLGRSYFSKNYVLDEILSCLPYTFLLALSAIAVSIITGLVFGVIAAIFKDTIIDQTILLFSLAGISAPVFFSAMAAIYLFSIKLGWLPPSGTGSNFENTVELRYLILPALTLGLRSGAFLTRITRTNMLEIINQPYIAAARARGISPAKLYFRHCLKNAMIPIVTVIGLDFSSYLNGSVITETIFSWPGIGRYIMTGITRRDLPAITASVLICSLIFLLMNLLVDLTYGYINPKLRKAE